MQAVLVWVGGGKSGHSIKSGGDILLVFGTKKSVCVRIVFITAWILGTKNWATKQPTFTAYLPRSYSRSYTSNTRCASSGGNAIFFLLLLLPMFLFYSFLTLYPSGKYYLWSHSFCLDYRGRHLHLRHTLPCSYPLDPLRQTHAARDPRKCYFTLFFHRHVDRRFGMRVLGLVHKLDLPRIFGGRVPVHKAVKDKKNKSVWASILFPLPLPFSFSFRVKCLLFY
jgi:hypothetical protein